MSDTIKHGGFRVGAGRKKTSEDTKVMRIPISRIDDVKHYLNQTKPIKQSDFTDIEQVLISTQYRIPVALERVAAGFPSPAQDYIESHIDLNEHLIKNQAATFIVTVGSSSMADIGIDVGDQVIVDRSIEAKHEDIVIALIDQELLTLKRLIIDSNETWLKAENPEHKDIHLKDGQSMEIWGVVTYVLRSFKKLK